MSIESLEKTEYVKESDAELGVKESPVFGTLIVDRKAWDGSDEPRHEIAALSPGDTVTICGEEATIKSVGGRMTYGQRGVYRLGLPQHVAGSVSTLYVDRTPYLLDVCNGPIVPLNPNDVKVDVG